MLKDFLPLELEYKAVPSDAITDFANKELVGQLIESTVSFSKEALTVPFFDERDLSKTIFNSSKQRRVLPFGFRVIDAKIEYTALGRAFVEIYAALVTRKPGDHRWSHDNLIYRKQMDFVFNHDTNRWYEVDLSNTNHEVTELYNSVKAQELELEASYKKQYFDYLEQFDMFVGADKGFRTKGLVEGYFLGFLEYNNVFEEGLEAYRFFKKLTPTEQTYIKKYMAYLLERIEKVFPNLYRVRDGIEAINMPENEKLLFMEVVDVAGEIKDFFLPRNEKNPLAGEVLGYSPTKHFKEELKGKRIVIPNIAEIERRMAFSSPDVFSNDTQEEGNLNKIKDELFGYVKKSDDEKQKKTELAPGVLGEKYGIDIEKREALKKLTGNERKQEFLKIAVAAGYRRTEYMNDFNNLSNLL